MPVQLHVFSPIHPHTPRARLVRMPRPKLPARDTPRQHSLSLFLTCCVVWKRALARAEGAMLSSVFCGRMLKARAARSSPME